MGTTAKNSARGAKALTGEQKYDLLTKDFLERDGDTFVRIRRSGRLGWEDTLPKDSAYSAAILSPKDGRELVLNAVKLARQMITAMDTPWKVDVRIDANVSCTDARTVFVATKVLDDGSLPLGRRLDTFLGLAVHEGSHLLYTDFGRLAAGLKGCNRTVNGLQNILEDEMIERRLGERKPGLANFLAATKYYYFGRYEKAAQGLAGDPATRLFNAILKMVRYPASLTREEIDEFADELLKARDILTPYPEDTATCIAKAKELFELFRRYIGKQKRQQSRQRQDQPQKGQEAEGEPGPGQGGEPDGSDGKDGDGSDGGNGDASDGKSRKDDKKPDRSEGNGKGSDDGQEDGDGSEDGSDGGSGGKDGKGEDSEDGKGSERGEGSDETDSKDSGDGQDSGPGSGDDEDTDRGDGKGPGKGDDGQDPEDGEGSGNGPDFEDGDDDDGGEDGDGRDDDIDDGDPVSDREVEDALRQIIDKVMDELTKDPTRGARPLRESDMSEAARENGHIVAMEAEGLLEQGDTDGVIILKKKPDRERYRQSLDRVRKHIPAIAAALRQNGTSYPYNLTGMRIGLLDTNKLCEARQGVPTVYMRKGTVKSDEIDVALVIDESGSMSGTGERLARDTAILMAEAASGVPNMGLYVYGYTSGHVVGRGRCLLYPYVEGGRGDRTNLGSITASGCTPTAHAIEEAASRIRKSSDRRTLLFVVSDGNSDEGYDAVRKACDRASADGFDVIGISISSDLSEGALRRMYTRWVDMKDASDLAHSLARCVKDAVLRNTRRNRGR